MAKDAKITVLIVDDNASLLRMLNLMLKDKYNVLAATSGDQVFSVIETRRPDVILLDYEMPVVNGRQILEKLRSDVKYKDIPVIFLTAMSDKKHIQSVLDLHPSGYLLKPPAAEMVLGEIEKAIREKEDPSVRNTGIDYSPESWLRIMQ